MPNYYIFAARPEDTSRLEKIEKHEFRDEFQRDRDRILYSKEFRRLSGKTQIFVSGFDDDIRTRLTHTLEVSQIATTIASKLELNTVLTEAIAYGHDVGHTPFGHIGERTLNYIMNGCISFYGYGKELKNTDKGFKHNLQGLRVVNMLENDEDDDPGLNLTKYTLWGIVNHTKKEYGICPYYLKDSGLCRYRNSNSRCDGKLCISFYDEFLKVLDDKYDWTFEGLIVSVADEIAQRHHDIEDGIYAGILDINILIQYLMGEFSEFELQSNLAKINEREKINNNISLDIKIKMLSKYFVDFYVKTYIEAFEDVFEDLKSNFKKLNSSQNFYNLKPEIWEYINGLSLLNKKLQLKNNFKELDKKISEYLKSRILLSEKAQSMDGKASFVIKRLVKAYVSNPQQLPDKTIISIVKEIDYEELYSIGIEDTVASKARKLLDDSIRNGDNKIKNILLRKICDYIAGMTDKYALEQYKKLYEVE